MILRRRLGKGFAAGALCLGLALAGCGRKGALEGPPGSHLPKAPKTNAKTSGLVTTETAGAPASAPVIRPKQSFLLDPLL